MWWRKLKLLFRANQSDQNHLGEEIIYHDGFHCQDVRCEFVLYNFKSIFWGFYRSCLLKHCCFKTFSMLWTLCHRRCVYCSLGCFLSNFQRFYFYYILYGLFNRINSSIIQEVLHKEGYLSDIQVHHLVFLLFSNMFTLSPLNLYNHCLCKLLFVVVPKSFHPVLSLRLECNWHSLELVCYHSEGRSVCWIIWPTLFHQHLPSIITTSWDRRPEGISHDPTFIWIHNISNHLVDC